MIKKNNVYTGNKRERPVVVFTKRFFLFVFLNIFLISVVSFFCFWGWRYIHRPSVLPFRSLTLSASANYVDMHLMQSIVRKSIDGGFFSFDQRRVEVALKKLPWIKSVSIRKVFPDRLIVHVEEYVPIAMWGKKILTDSGVLLSVEQPPTLGLPILLGPQDSMKEMWSEYQSLSRMVRPLNLVVQKLLLSNRHSWSLILSGGLEVVLGRDNSLDRFRRFVSCYHQLLHVHAGVMWRVDLRYSSGMAVRWSA